MLKSYYFHLRKTFLNEKWKMTLKNVPVHLACQRFGLNSSIAELVLLKEKY